MADLRTQESFRAIQLKMDNLTTQDGLPDTRDEAEALHFLAKLLVKATKQGLLQAKSDFRSYLYNLEAEVTPYHIWTREHPTSDVAELTEPRVRIVD